jgi:hypothetical protein
MISKLMAVQCDCHPPGNSDQRGKFEATCCGSDHIVCRLQLRDTKSAFTLISALGIRDRDWILDRVSCQCKARGVIVDVQAGVTFHRRSAGVWLRLACKDKLPIPTIRSYPLRVFNETFAKTSTTPSRQYPPPQSFDWRRPTRIRDESLQVTG